MRVRLKLQFGGAQQIKFYYLIQIIYIILYCAINESYATPSRRVERNSIDSKWAANSLTDRHHNTNEYSEYAFVIGGNNNNRHVRSKSDSNNKERKTRSPHRHPHSYHYHHRQRHEVAADEEEDVERKRTALSSTVESFARQQQQQVNLAGAVASSNSSESASSSGSVQRDYMAAVIGKDVQLDCRMKNLANDDDKIVWLKMPKGEVLTLNSNRVTSDARVNTRCISNSVPCWSLIITNTRESDTGFYVCQTNAMQTKYVYLDIMVPPKLLTQYPVDRIDVNQSSNATITCEFYGKPDPLIKWYKYNNGVQKEIEKFRGSKTISFYIHKDSSSEYECVADNSIPPTVSKKIYLNIQYAPQIKFLNSKVFQKKGERVIFDCNVNSNPLSKIYWYKNQTRIYESYKFNFENLDDSYHRLYINNLTDGDFGDYYCTAVNILGKSTSKIQLIELRSPNEHKKPTSSSSSKPSTTIQTTSSLQTTSSIATQSSTPEDRFEGYQSPFWPTNDLFGVVTTTTASSSTVETNQNETVIRISLNRDKLDYYDQPLEDKKFEQITSSSTRTKSQSVAKLPTYRSNTKHHLHNKTKAITKNQRKQIQKPYVNSPNNKPASSTSSISSIYSETSGAVESTNRCCYSLPLFISFHLLAILFYSYL